MKDRSPWLELHLSAPKHRKTDALATALGVDRVTALGHVCCVWLWALEQAQDGDLAMFSEQAVADGGGWRKKPHRFIEALISSGYMNPDKRLHEWECYVGKLMERRRKDRDRQRIVPSTSKGASTGTSLGSSTGVPQEARTSQTTDDRRQSTAPSSSSAGAQGARTAADWYEAVSGNEPRGAAFLSQLENLDFAHGPDCVAWGFGLATGKQEPWPYAKRVFDACESEGHGPRVSVSKPKRIPVDPKLEAHNREVAEMQRRAAQ